MFCAMRRKVVAVVELATIGASLVTAGYLYVTQKVHNAAV